MPTKGGAPIISNSKGTSEHDFSRTAADIALLPSTCLEQTRIQQTDPQYWTRLWKEMEQILHDHQDDQSLIQYLRENRRARHVASLLLYKAPRILNQVESLSNNQPREREETILYALTSIWSQILVLPPEPSSALPSPATSALSSSKHFDISLIIPAFQVSLHEMKGLLEYTLDHCQSPATIQVIVVEVVRDNPDSNNQIGPIAQGLADGLLVQDTDSSTLFGAVQVIPYDGSRGRGGCLNHGARQASGKILTFLHADTFMPKQWDIMVRKAIQPSTTSGTTSTVTTMCAFSMGIDISPFQSGTVPMPVGLWGADYILGAIRCSLCELPYGDSVLSLPAHIFEYLGGYPDQPLMEDFELVQLLRRRATLFPNEQIAIIPDRIACSPRRWQNFGVAYVILANAYCIYRYRFCQAPSEDIFEFYYGPKLSY
jgi:hypothetical protein